MGEVNLVFKLLGVDILVEGANVEILQMKQCRLCPLMFYHHLDQFDYCCRYQYQADDANISVDYYQNIVATAKAQISEIYETNIPDQKVEAMEEVDDTFDQQYLLPFTVNFMGDEEMGQPQINKDNRLMVNILMAYLVDRIGQEKLPDEIKTIIEGFMKLTVPTVESPRDVYCSIIDFKPSAVLTDRVKYTFY